MFWWVHITKYKSSRCKFYIYYLRDGHSSEKRGLMLDRLVLAKSLIWIEEKKKKGYNKVRNQMILPIYHTYQPPDVRSHFFHAGTMVQKRWKGLGRIWSVEHHIQLAHCVNFVTKERLSNSLIFSDLLQTKLTVKK